MTKENELDNIFIHFGQEISEPFKNAIYRAYNHGVEKAALVASDLHEGPHGKDCVQSEAGLVISINIRKLKFKNVGEEE